MKDNNKTGLSRKYNQKIKQQKKQLKLFSAQQRKANHISRIVRKNNERPKQMEIDRQQQTNQSNSKRQKKTLLVRQCIQRVQNILDYKLITLEKLTQKINNMYNKQIKKLDKHSYKIHIIKMLVLFISSNFKLLKNTSINQSYSKSGSINFYKQQCFQTNRDLTPRTNIYTQNYKINREDKLRVMHAQIYQHIISTINKYLETHPFKSKSRILQASIQKTQTRNQIILFEQTERGTPCLNISQLKCNCQKQLHNFVKEIIWTMVDLEQMGITHNDIKAQNFIIKGNKAQLGDFKNSIFYDKYQSDKNSQQINAKQKDLFKQCYKRMKQGSFKHGYDYDPNISLKQHQATTYDHKMEVKNCEDQQDYCENIMNSLVQRNAKQLGFFFLELSLPKESVDQIKILIIENRIEQEALIKKILTKYYPQDNLMKEVISKMIRYNPASLSEISDIFIFSQYQYQMRMEQQPKSILDNFFQEVLNDQRIDIQN